MFNHLWGSKFLPEMAAELRRNDEKFSDAFTNATLTVCGEELRQLTGRDLLMLDGFENGFVCGRGIPDEGDRDMLLWALNVENDRTRKLKNLWRKGKFEARMQVRDADVSRNFEEDCAEIAQYMDRMYLDLGDDVESDEEKAKRQNRPPPCNFLATLLVDVGARIGAIDPFSGSLLADSPIPRLIQYQRAARTGDEERATRFDSMRSRCLEEVNRILLARREKKT